MAETLDILVVDDSYADRTLLELAFRKVGKDINLRFCETGKQALDFLFNEGGNNRTAMPSVCLLDINMPGLSGFDVLKAIKSNAKTRTLSVYMFSSSDNPQDVAQSYANASNGFLLKPRTQEELGTLVKSLVYLWTGPHKFVKPNQFAELDNFIEAKDL